ncbi:MAG TPA: ACP S-malonyltransferase [Coriobacteriia bacterium]
MTLRRHAFLFPGQGSQRLGMLDALPDAGAGSRLLDAAEALSGLDLRTIASSGTPEQIADTRAAQPLLYVADWMWGQALLREGLAPLAVAGHSLGELAALAFAGVYSVEAGLELVVERSRLMARCAASTPGGMVAVLGMDGADVSAAIQDVAGVWVANDNAPGQVVISGTHAGLEAATGALAEAGARRLVPLPVAGPFHSPLMGDAADSFSALLDRASFTDARIPVYQNADPEPATAAAAIKRRLSRQIASPVRWTETMLALVRDGATTAIEAGPGSVLAGLARRVERLHVLSAEEMGPAAVKEEVVRG